MHCPAKCANRPKVSFGLGPNAVDYAKNLVKPDGKAQLCSKSWSTRAIAKMIATDQSFT
jgi:hypothetical protein